MKQKNTALTLKMGLKTVLAVFLAAIIYLGFAPVQSFADSEPVTYLDKYGTEQSVVPTNYVDNLPDASGINMYDENSPGYVSYYVVRGNKTFGNRLTAFGEVHLILCDGATLTANKGIYVPTGSSLTIYAQSTGDNKGKLVATGEGDAAGIGGKEDMSNGLIVINGGDITARGGDHAAGIGGGDEGHGGGVEINGGKVTATGGKYGAGIGGGDEGGGGSITINGGELKVVGGEEAAGIGGGDKASGGSTTINGGKVKTDGGVEGAGIGGGRHGHAGTVVINGGEVESFGTGKASSTGATGGGAGIGGGAENNIGSNNTDHTAGGTIIINGGKVDARGGSAGGYLYGGSGIGCGNNTQYGCRIEIKKGDIFALAGAGAAAIGGGMSSYGGTIVIQNHSTDLKIKAQCQEGVMYGDLKYENYCVGSGTEGKNDARITFDYPAAKVHIRGDFGYMSFSETTVNAEKREAALRWGNNTFNQLWIEPCPHAGRYYDKTETGHVERCHHCSLGADGIEAAHLFENDKCSVCGYERPHVHDWGEWETVTEATCSQEGSERRVCTINPEHVEIRPVPKNDRHENSGSREERTPATCTAYGELNVITYCEDCGETINIVHTGIAPLGHDWGDWRTVTPASDTENGLEQRVCTRDDSHIETRVIPAGGHVHDLREVAAEEASCTKEGNCRYWICDQGDHPCGGYFADAEGSTPISQQETILPKKEHTRGEAVKENPAPATCETPASYESVIYCTVCEAQLSRNTVKEGSALGHHWGPWTVITEATEQTDGEQQRVCQNDPTHIETEVIPKTGTDDGIIPAGAGSVLSFTGSYRETEDAEPVPMYTYLAIANSGWEFDRWAYEVPEGVTLLEEEGGVLSSTGGFLQNVVAYFKEAPVSIQNAKVVLSKTAFTYNGKVQKPSVKTIGGKALRAGTDYTVSITNSKKKAAASPKGADTYVITITGKGKYIGATKAVFKINKAPNPLKIKKKAGKVKLLKAKGKKTCKLISVKKGKKSFKKYFKINKKTGKVKLKKKVKLPKGTYKVKIKVKAKGTANYRSSGWKKATFKIKIK